jgi:GTP-binding protein EngB required for normal cell division
MCRDGNPNARLKFSRLYPFGDQIAGVRDPAAWRESKGEQSSLWRGSADEAAGSGSRASLDQLLTCAITSIADPSEAQEQILDKLRALRKRFEEGRLRVAVLGQFKRGKSTLLNALLGAPLLPTGVTPVTAISTFVEASDSTWVRVAFNGGKAPIVTSAAHEIPSVLERHISEAQNPHNRLDVASVTIGVRSDFLDEGIVLVDTPGVGSTFVHNTAAAEAVLTECDAALFVLSADPPITEAEATYLDKVRRLIAKIFFVLNKVDLLDDGDKTVAEQFLAGVLAERCPAHSPQRIFSLSAKRGLEAKLARDIEALEVSGLLRLESVLGGELAREKQAILLATGRQRLRSLVGELLFQSELERKALMTPADELKRKAATFESSAAEFESERQRLSDLLSIDRRRLLRELDAETDRVWNGARAELRQVMADFAEQSFEAKPAHERVSAALFRYFEQALNESLRLFRAKLDERAAGHSARADALVDLVRQTAADLMEVSVSLPRSEEAFQSKSDPYWVAPEPEISLLGLSAGLAGRLLPRAIREKRARAQLIAEADRAALRNVANLDWAMRQNIEDSFRQFESSLSAQLDQALKSTRQAMQLALARRAARSEAVKGDTDLASRSVTALSNILTELNAIAPTPQSDKTREGPQPC